MRTSLAFLLLIFSFCASAQITEKYFGYFYNDANGSFAENYGHINLYHIDTFIIGNNTVDRDATTQYMLGEMAKAKARGVHVIITAAPFVFYFTNSPQSWSNEPNAKIIWSQVVDKMIAAGYLVPGSPQASTIAAIYLVDEPDGQGLGDSGQNANPAVVNAVNAIRGDARTANIPIASILTHNFVSGFSHGLTLLDWVGFDWYGASQGDWTNTYNNLKSRLATNQRTILVPKAATGSGMGNGPPDDPNWFFNVMKNDPKVVWFSPFVWFTIPNRTGTRDIPDIRSAYTGIGSEIKAAGCQSSASEQAYCLGSGPHAAIVSIITNLLLK